MQIAKLIKMILAKNLISSKYYRIRKSVTASSKLQNVIYEANEAAERQ